MVKLSAILALAGALAPLHATTLQQLTMAEMIQKSTAVVRARVRSSAGVARGTDIYTVYRLDVLETWKAPAGETPREIAVPGGAASGVRQVAPGAPTLSPGEEYVLFLWTGRSGLTQVIGLSQGLFRVKQDASGAAVATRAAADELMLDASGHSVQDLPISMKLGELKARVIRESASREQAARRPQEAR